VLAGLALGVSVFGGFVLPGLRAEMPAGQPVEQPFVLSEVADKKDCKRPDAPLPQL
jgi:hypothetical protein